MTNEKDQTRLKNKELNCNIKRVKEKDFREFKMAFAKLKVFNQRKLKIHWEKNNELTTSVWLEFILLIQEHY